MSISQTDYLATKRRTETPRKILVKEMCEFWRILHGRRGGKNGASSRQKRCESSRVELIDSTCRHIPSLKLARLSHAIL